MFMPLERRHACGGSDVPYLDRIISRSARASRPPSSTPKDHTVSACPSSVAMHTPVARHQILIVSSEDPLASCPPASAAKEQPRMRGQPACPSIVALKRPPNFHGNCAVRYVNAAKKHRAINPVRSTKPAHDAIPCTAGAEPRISDAVVVLPIGCFSHRSAKYRL